jgi:hypothetical protein
MYPVPCNVGLHVASPFWSTLAKGMTRPTQAFGFALGALVNSPTHHITSLLVSAAGDGGWLNVPVAANWNWPFCAVATEGWSVTLSRWRPLPQLKAVTRRTKRGPTERIRNPLTMHLRTNVNASGMNPYEQQVAPADLNSNQRTGCAPQQKSLLRGASLKRPVKNRGYASIVSQPVSVSSFLPSSWLPLKVPPERFSLARVNDFGPLS